jgi:hypothetical protein
MVRCFVASAPAFGPITIGTFVPGYQTFAAGGVTNGVPVSYNLTDYDGVVLPGFPYGSETGWEVGVSPYSTAGPSLTRNPLFSSNGNAAINASANAHVWVTALAADFIDTVAVGLTAAGTSQGTALILTAQFNEVTTVGPGLSVIIPYFMNTPGQHCFIASYGANPLLVWPLSGQSFMSGGVNNGLNEPLILQAGIVGQFRPSSPTTVYSVP